MHSHATEAPSVAAEEESGNADVRDPEQQGPSSLLSGERLLGHNFNSLHIPAFNYSLAYWMVAVKQLRALSRLSCH